MTTAISNSSTNKRLPRIGDLRHQLSLFAPVATPDGAGGSVIVYALQTQLWGDIRANSGLSHLDADRLENRVSYSIWVRYHPALTPDHRLEFGARTFLIRSVLDHDGRTRFQECLCEEIVT